MPTLYWRMRLSRWLLIIIKGIQLHQKSRNSLTVRIVYISAFTRKWFHHSAFKVTFLSKNTLLSDCLLPLFTKLFNSYTKNIFYFFFVYHVRILKFSLYKQYDEDVYWRIWSWCSPATPASPPSATDHLHLWNFITPITQCRNHSVTHEIHVCNKICVLSHWSQMNFS